VSRAAAIVEADTALGATAVDKITTTHRALEATVIVAAPPPFPFVVSLDNLDVCVVYLDVRVVSLDD
jgi:hypothetical protein